MQCALAHFYHCGWRKQWDNIILNLQQEFKDLDEKFKKAMFHNAQLDNEKASFSYQVELLKDQIEQLEESHFLLQVSCGMLSEVNCY